MGGAHLSAAGALLPGAWPKKHARGGGGGGRGVLANCQGNRAGAFLFKSWRPRHLLQVGPADFVLRLDPQVFVVRNVDRQDQRAVLEISKGIAQF